MKHPSVPCPWCHRMGYGLMNYCDNCGRCFRGPLEYPIDKIPKGEWVWEGMKP